MLQNCVLRVFQQKKKKIGNEEVEGRVLMRGVEVTQKQI